MGFEQSRHGARNPGENGLRLLRLGAGCLALFFLLFELDRLPIAQHFGGSLGSHVPKDMGVAGNQFVGKPIEHVVNRERPLFASQLRVEQDL